MRKFTIGVAALALIATACTSDGATGTTSTPSVAPEAPVATTVPETTSPTTSVPASTTTVDPTALILEFTGLSPLLNDAHYEGWVIVGGEPVSIGKFNVDAEGQVTRLDGRVTDSFSTGVDLSTVTSVVITIEPAFDDDTVPADTHILAGDLVDGSADLSVAHPAALGSDYLDVAGKYFLGTPTNGNGTDELSGIWFINREPRGPSLKLPELPDGWNYESWVVIDGVPLTGGTFRSPAEPDDAAPFSGSEPGPEFPGEDYLANAPGGVVLPTDLSGAGVVISIEPSPDDDVAPFALKPLVGAVPAGAADHTDYELENAATAFPAGTAARGA
jgi:hypothetical protein